MLISYMECREISQRDLCGSELRRITIGSYGWPAGLGLSPSVSRHIRASPSKRKTCCWVVRSRYQCHGDPETIDTHYDRRPRSNIYRFYTVGRTLLYIAEVYSMLKHVADSKQVHITRPRNGQLLPVTFSDSR